jgi:hypothetical protein
VAREVLAEVGIGSTDSVSDSGSDSSDSTDETGLTRRQRRKLDLLGEVEEVGPDAS